jgi:inosine/xanthosine triphosphate pyrophosphatase family protein
MKMTMNPKSLKYKKFYFASGNRSKIARLRRIFRWISEEIGENLRLEAVPEQIEVDENEATLEGNSLKKALVYKGKYDIPVISLDSGIFIKEEEIDPVKVKRNALHGEPETKFTKKEISQKVHAYYQDIARKHGGEVDFYFKDVYTILWPDGSHRQASAVRRYTLTTIAKGPLTEFPLKSLYFSKATGKRPFEQTEEDEQLELKPVREAILKLISET